jgi:hypothetical protein
LPHGQTQPEKGDRSWNQRTFFEQEATEGTEEVSLEALFPPLPPVQFFFAMFWMLVLDRLRQETVALEDF